MKVWGTKPPPRLSSANRPLSRATMPRERCSGGRGSGVSSWPTSTAAERSADGDEPGRGGDRVEQQPLRRGTDERDQRARRAGERGDRVVGAEEGRRVAPSAACGSIACSSEVNGPDSTTSVESVPVSAAAISAGSQPVSAKTVPATRHQDEEQRGRSGAARSGRRGARAAGGERVAGEERGEDGADGRVRVAAPASVTPMSTEPRP